MYGVAAGIQAKVNLVARRGGQPHLAACKWLDQHLLVSAFFYYSSTRFRVWNTSLLVILTADYVYKCSRILYR